MVSLRGQPPIENSAAFEAYNRRSLEDFSIWLSQFSRAALPSSIVTTTAQVSREFHLRLRGRSPEFLYLSVVYTTFPVVTCMLRDCGFEFVRDERICTLIESPARIE